MLATKFIGRRTATEAELCTHPSLLAISKRIGGVNRLAEPGSFRSGLLGPGYSVSRFLRSRSCPFCCEELSREYLPMILVFRGNVTGMFGAVLDTNVFVAAAFNSRSASARVIAAVREGRLQLIWNGSTRREVELILRQIPPLAGRDLTVLFNSEGKFGGPTDPQTFAEIPDPDDRKFAALSAAAKRPLVTSDKHLLQHNAYRIEILTPGAFCRKYRAELET